MSETKKKILVVDDEAQIIRVMRHILSAHQYEMRTANDGESAIEVFEYWQPDLVITDLQMPNVNGLELCRRLRKISAVPIIVLSVRDEEETIIEALDTGADDYVTKPFGTNELLARVRSCLRRTPEKPENITGLGDFIVDTVGHKVMVRGAEIHLTPKEFD